MQPGRHLEEPAEPRAGGPDACGSAQVTAPEGGRASAVKGAGWAAWQRGGRLSFCVLLRLGLAAGPARAYCLPGPQFRHWGSAR